MASREEESRHLRGLLWFAESACAAYGALLTARTSHEGVAAAEAKLHESMLALQASTQMARSVVGSSGSKGEA